jgi:hypothetical protein
MANTNFSLKIDRRRLLTSAVAVTMVNIAPIAAYAEAHSPDAVRTLPQKSEISASDVCAGTARRLLEIARRNQIREEAGLPLLSVVRELRQMKQREDAHVRRQEFESFQVRHRQAAWDQALSARRATENDPHWQPRTFADGVRYQRESRKILWQQFYLAKSRRSAATMQAAEMAVL